MKPNVLNEMSQIPEDKKKKGTISLICGIYVYIYINMFHLYIS